MLSLTTLLSKLVKLSSSEDFLLLTLFLSLQNYGHSPLFSLFLEAINQPFLEFSVNLLRKFLIKFHTGFLLPTVFC